MQNRTLNPKQRKFIQLYLGRDPRFYGHATECYKRVYNSDADDRVAQSAGARLLKVPAIKAIIDKAEEKALQQVGIDAAWVLEQAVELYDRAMGYKGVDVERVTEDDDGTQVVETTEVRDFNPAIAAKSLEIIGKHTQVQAFQDNVNHTHTHVLEDRLSRRVASIEARARTLQQHEDAAQLQDHINGAGPISEVRGAPALPAPDRSASRSAGASAK